MGRGIEGEGWSYPKTSFLPFLVRDSAQIRCTQQRLIPILVIALWPGCSADWQSADGKPGFGSQVGNLQACIFEKCKTKLRLVSDHLTAVIGWGVVALRAESATT